MYVDLYTARLPACEVVYLKRNIITLKITPTLAPPLKSNLSSSAMGIFSGEYCLIIVQLADYVSRGVSMKLL